LEWLGKVATSKGQFDVAMGHYEKSWAVAASDVPEHLRPRMFALLWLQRARTMFLAGDFHDARQTAEQAVAYFMGTGESDNLAKSLLVAARSAVACGDAAAADLARRAAALFRQDGSVRGEAEALEIVVDLAAEADEVDRLRQLRDELDPDIP